MKRSHKHMLGIMSVILGIAILLMSLSFTWIQINIADGLGPERVLSIAAKTWDPMLNALIMVLICGTIVQFLLKGKLIYGVGIIVVLVEICLIFLPSIFLVSSRRTLIAQSRQISVFSDRYTVMNVTIHVFGPALTIFGGLIALIGSIMMLKYPRQYKQVSPAVRKSITADTTQQIKGSPAGTVEKNISQSAQGIPASISEGEKSLDNISMWQAIDAGIDLTDTDTTGPTTFTG